MEEYNVGGGVWRAVLLSLSIGLLQSKCFSNFSLQSSKFKLYGPFYSLSHPYSLPLPHAPPAHSLALSSTSHFPTSAPFGPSSSSPSPPPPSHPHVEEFSELHPQLFVVVVSTLPQTINAPSTSPSPPHLPLSLPVFPSPPSFPSSLPPTLSPFFYNSVSLVSPTLLTSSLLPSSLLLPLNVDAAH